MTVSMIPSNPSLLRPCRYLQHRHASIVGRGISNISDTTTIRTEQARTNPRRHQQQSRKRSTLASASFSNRHEILQPQLQTRQFAWWNPFSKKGVRDTNAVVGSSRTKSETEDEEPRKLQERKDLTLLMLALEFHKIAAEEDRLRTEAAETEDDDQSQTPTTTTITAEEFYLQHRESMIDRAFARLEEMEIDNKSMMQLRYALQEGLEDQVKELFDIFCAIDEELLLLLLPAESSNNHNPIDMESYLEEIMRLELERTIDELANTKRRSAPKGADPNEFLTLKRGAIETLLDRTANPQTPMSEEEDSDTSTEPSWSETDEFGYHESIDQERNRLIRHYQSINLCRSAKMRDKLGYSVVALKSSIPGAGRGVYVDGYARAGSILAFQPGPVWAKENLVNLSIDEERDLERNDAYQMSLRSDDYMIDSRRAPYTVLTDDNSNLMALGHIVNHPTPSKPPSCRSAMLNFTKGMDIGSSAELKRYIPNTYARPRNVTLMNSLWDRDVIEMHSLILVATRDICNEEIFYDYRLASSHLPQWYHQVNDTAYEEVNEEFEEEEEEVDEQEEKKD
eukprot:CAMPEP_0116149624 /NCGR_PEP_ID=MMETSP0329-20121206/19071_1 /TAXON_ID=697910 /ORGANISM="Pseudo-nitzschia arenysensis, Strain B593" /LENGTH=566 /DNA_ID=CAMNT_0003645999 /DNA_START=49 /DNA_END=1749 /DNA_ORIENTATION=+